MGTMCKRWGDGITVNSEMFLLEIQLKEQEMYGL